MDDTAPTPCPGFAGSPSGGGATKVAAADERAVDADHRAVHPSSVTLGVPRRCTARVVSWVEVVDAIFVVEDW